MHGSVVARHQVVVVILRGHRHSGGLPGGRRRRRGHGEVMDDRRAIDERVQDVGRDLLYAGVRDVAVPGVKRRAPGDRSGGKDPRPARRPVEDRVGVVGQTVDVRVGRLGEDGETGREGRGELGLDAIHFVPDNPRNGIAIVEPGTGVHPVRAVRHDVGDAGCEIDVGGELDTPQKLLGAVHGCGTEMDRGGRVLHRIDAGVLVAHHHPVSHAVRGRLETDLPAGNVGAEEPEVDAGGLSGLGSVEHFLRPVFVMADGKECLATQKGGAIFMSIDVGAVGDVIAVAFEPADVIGLPPEELSGTVAAVGPIKRHFDRPRLLGDRGGAIAVKAVQALPRGAVVRVIVVGLVGADALLVAEGGGPAIPDDEDDVILVAGGIGQQRHVDSGRPVGGDGQGVARTPATGDQAGYIGMFMDTEGNRIGLHNPK